MREYQLLTAKPVVFAVNVGEDQEGSPAVRRVMELAMGRGARAVTIAGSIEAEVAAFAPEDRADYFRELGMGEGGLVRDDLIAYGNEAGVKEKGLFRLEGRDYVIKDGDVMFFRFNV